MIIIFHKKHIRVSQFGSVCFTNCVLTVVICAYLSTDVGGGDITKRENQTFYHPDSSCRYPNSRLQSSCQSLPAVPFLASVKWCMLCLGHENPSAKTAHSCCGQHRHRLGAIVRCIMQIHGQYMACFNRLSCFPNMVCKEAAHKRHLVDIRIQTTHQCTVTFSASVDKVEFFLIIIFLHYLYLTPFLPRYQCVYSV